MFAGSYDRHESVGFSPQTFFPNKADQNIDEKSKHKKMWHNAIEAWIMSLSGTEERKFPQHSEMKPSI